MHGLLSTCARVLHVKTQMDAKAATSGWLQRLQDTDADHQAELGRVRAQLTEAVAQAESTQRSQLQGQTAVEEDLRRVRL